MFLSRSLSLYIPPSVRSPFPTFSSHFRSLFSLLSLSPFLSHAHYHCRPSPFCLFAVSETQHQKHVPCGKATSRYRVATRCEESTGCRARECPLGSKRRVQIARRSPRKRCCPKQCAYIRERNREKLWHLVCGHETWIFLAFAFVSEFDEVTHFGVSNHLLDLTQIPVLCSRIIDISGPA